MKTPTRILVGCSEVTCPPRPVQQAAVGDCLPFDPFPFDQNGPAPPEVDVGGRQVADARHDSATADALTVTMRYPVEEALRAKARGGIAEIAYGI